MALACQPTNCPPWSLHFWPPLLWQVTRESRGLPARLQHLGTHLTTNPQPEGLCAGQTLWVADDERGEWGLAWDWVEVRRGVLAMADPLAVLTNLRLVGEAGEPLPMLEAARHFSGLVHTLPWQHEVGRAVSRQLQ